MNDGNLGSQLHIESSPSTYPMSSQNTAALAGVNNSGSMASDEEGATMELMDVFAGAENNFTQDSSNFGPSQYPGGDSDPNFYSGSKSSYPQKDYDDQDRQYSNVGLNGELRERESRNPDPRQRDSLNEFRVNLANRNQSMISNTAQNNLYSKQRRLATGELILNQKKDEAKFVPEKKLASQNMASIYR